MIVKNGFLICIKKGNVQIEYNLNEAFNPIVVETDSFFLLLEGLIANTQALKQNAGYKADFKGYITQLFIQHGKQALQMIEGEVRGFFWDKEKQAIFAFTNHTATQRVFYYNQEDCFCCSSSLPRLVTQLKSLGENVSPDEFALRQLLSFKVMLEDYTPVLKVKKLLEGHWLSYNLEDKKCKTEPYFSPFGKKAPESKQACADALHQAFVAATAMEYNLDAVYPSVTLLSGGLDSRMALFYAKEKWAIKQLFCFSQSGYLDHKISKKIAADYQLPYDFQALDGGGYLKNIDRLTEISEGTSLFLGGIHVDYAFRRQGYNHVVIHSGQIGDGILGGFNTQPREAKPNLNKIKINRLAYNEIAEEVQRILDKHPHEEAFYLRNIAYNRTVLGAQVSNLYGYQFSPFMSKDFLQLALAIPAQYKFAHQLYLRWIAEYRLAASRYVWERTGMRPDKDWKTKLSNRFLAPIKYKVLPKLGFKASKLGMTPYQYYFAQSQELKDSYRNYFNTHIDRVSHLVWLKQEVERLFSNAQFYDKALAVNILAIFKLYFDE